MDSDSYLCGVVNTNLSMQMSKKSIFIVIDVNNIGAAEAYTTRSAVAKRLGCNRKTITKESPVIYKGWMVVETQLSTAKMGFGN